MVSLLDATAPYIDRFKGIRISTRPDAINDEILNILKSYKVTSIELGAQSMVDSVLDANNRGHSCDDVVQASRLIKEYGFSLGLQMMTGLYKSTAKFDLETAKKFIELKPDTVRIYPTVVMKDTTLETVYLNGDYKTMSMEETVELCSQLLLLFEDNGIPVIRLGLHHTESLESQMVAGCYHPSFRELCESKIMYNKLFSLLKISDTRDVYEVLVSPKCVSKLIGNNKSNIKRLNESGFNIKITQSNDVSYMEVILK